MVFISPEQLKAPPVVEEATPSLHPLANALRACDQPLSEVRTDLFRIVSDKCNSNRNTKEQELITDRYGFLIDKVREVSPFSVSAEELLPVWELAMDTFALRYERYAFAQAIVGVYVTQELSGPWEQLPYFMLRMEPLTDEYYKDEKNFQRVYRRILGLQEMMNNYKAKADRTGSCEEHQQLLDEIKDTHLTKRPKPVKETDVTDTEMNIYPEAELIENMEFALFMYAGFFSLE